MIHLGVARASDDLIERVTVIIRARLARGGSVSCGTHRKGGLFDHHVCVVCGGAFTGHGRGGQILGYGPVTAPYCSEPCGKPASAFLRALHADLTTNANYTTQED
jgi:hypothetical protein